MTLILSADERCVLWPYSDQGSGYGTVLFAGRRMSTHVVACEWANGPRPEGQEAAHFCGQRRCVNPNHIRWATHRENAADQLIHETRARGEVHGISRLSEDQVRDIRRRIASGETQRSIAVDLGVHFVTINDIHRRRTWGWLP